MEKSPKYIVLVLVVVSTIFLGLCGALFLSRQQEIDKRILVENKLEETTAAKIKLTKDLEEIVSLKNDLEIKAGALQEKASGLEAQLDQEKRSREAVFAQLESEKKESKGLVDDLLKLRGEKEQVALDLAGVNSECKLLKVQLFNVQQAKEVLESKLKGMMARGEVELEKIIVKPEEPGTSEPGVIQPQNEFENVSVAVGDKIVSPAEIKGEVLVVNKKFNFVVVGLGESANISPGMSLAAYRNGKFLTVLQVEKVHANMSAAKIPAGAKDIDIREGDTVVVVQ